jgi:indole-3-glycerol phosphate synthase
MPSILDDIVVQKRKELARQKEQVPLADLEKRIASQPPALVFSGALRGRGVQLIAEVKKASPSRGLLCPDFDPVRLAGIYASNGAAAISVLTDPRFQGQLEHIAQIKRAGVAQRAPVLRKDFIFDPYQVYEARAMGADALLLIVAILAPQQLEELLALSWELGMQCLVEVHDKWELQTALGAGAEIIGINNRNLRTFAADLAVTERLAPLVPRGKIIVSESGINSQEHVKRLAQMGVNAVLVGEALVTAPDVAEKVRELSGQALPSAGRGGGSRTGPAGRQPSREP